MSAAIKNREFALAFLEGKKVLYKPSHHKEFDPADDVRNLGTFDEHGFDFCIAPATISINGVEVPEPMREEPKIGDITFAPAITDPTLVYYDHWEGHKYQLIALNRGVLHATREAANAHAKALILASGGKP